MHRLHTLLLCLRRLQLRMSVWFKSAGHWVPMLAGGTATLPGLKDRVTELTGFASMVVNPFENMKLGSAVRESKLRREAPSYLTACGLAMRRFLQ